MAPVFMAENALAPFQRTRRYSQLTVGEACFLEALITRRVTNRTDAYIQYVGTPDMDRVAASRAAWKLLRRPHVRQQVRELQRIALSAVRASAERLLSHASAVACADRTQICNPDGSMKLPADWPQDIKDAIDSFEVEERIGNYKDPETGEMVRGVISRRFKPKFGGSRLAAVELLMKFRGMLAQEGNLQSAAVPNTGITVITDPNMEPGPPE